MSKANTEVQTQEEAQEETRTEVRIAAEPQHEELYDPGLDTAFAWAQIRQSFVRGILREVGKDFRFASGRTLDTRPPTEEEPGALLVYPDETRIFVGLDKTAHTRGDFGFAVQPSDPMPMPSTVEDALNLLKPLGVRKQLEEDGELPPRQGEWWLLETSDRTPASRVFKGGVNERPFNGSPLENHVPTEFAFGVPEDELLAWFNEEYPNIANDDDSLLDILDRLQTASEIEELEDVEPQYERPSFSEVQDAADGVFVRGTLRHRENDHYMERIGEDWMLARTHDITVYTADNTSASRVRRD